jgi:hypothetical protein
MSNQRKSEFINRNFGTKISGEDMAKFCPNLNLGRKVGSGQNSDSANQSSFRQL